MLKEVNGEGSLSPKIALFGEAPGAEENWEGRPFVGSSGHTLDISLAIAGVGRQECYLDNVVPIRPPDNKIERLGEYGVGVEDFHPRLKVILNKIDCDVVVALGETALRALTGLEGISKHRGSCYSCIWDTRKRVIPTFHPRFINEQFKMRGVVVEDVRKALRVRKEGYHEPTFNTIIRPTFEEIQTTLERIRQGDRFSFDIEVVGWRQIACVGIGYFDHSQHARSSICIPLKFGYQNYWNEFEERFIWEALRELFQSDLLKIGQNINYDLSKLLPFIGEPAPPWYDLMLAHHLIDAELPHTLAFMTSLYTFPIVNYYKDDPKDEEKSWKYMSSSEKLWEYNGKDVEVPLMIEPTLTGELERLGMRGFFEGFLMSKMRVLWRVQQRGMRLDEEKRKELLDKQCAILERKQKELDEIAGYPLNPNSHKQMTKFLYQDLGLAPQKKRKTKKVTADEEALTKLYIRHPHPALRLALEIRAATHEIGTYLMVEADPDGKVRGRYNAAGTTTGRSSSKKGYEGRGLDWHNIPEQDRQMFVAEEGSTFIGRDLWQAETFVVAMLSQCQAFLERLRQGKKIHRLVASWLFGVGEDEVDSNNRPGGQYYTGKRVGHALNYGMGAVLLAMTLIPPVINREEEYEKGYTGKAAGFAGSGDGVEIALIKKAEEYRRIYFKFAPEIVSWHQEVQEELKRTRMLVTPFGRKRVFRERWGEDLFKQAYAHTPQSLIGELNHLGMIKLEYMLPEGAEIVQEGYDALLVESQDWLVERVRELMEEAFKKKIFCKGEWFEVPGEVTMGKRWMK